MAEITCNEPNTVNLTDENEAKKQLYNRSASIWVVYMMPVVLSFGLLSNGAFLIVVCRIRSMQTKTNAYLANLAIADLLFLILAVVGKIKMYASSPVFYDESHFGPVGCNFWLLAVDSSYFASLNFVSLVSLDKYHAICMPLKYRLLRNEQARTVKCITVAWLVALLTALCLVPAHSVYTTLCAVWPESEEYSDFPSQISYCGPISTIAAHAGNGFQATPFISGLILNTVLYCKIIKKLDNRVSSQEQPRSNNNNRLQVRNQATKMLIINTVIFFVCLAPFEMLSFATMIVGLTENILLDENQINELLQASRTMAYLNAALNPLVYCVCNSRYRNAFKRCLPFVRTRVHPVNGKDMASVIRFPKDTTAKKVLKIGATPFRDN